MSINSSGHYPPASSPYKRQNGAVRSALKSYDRGWHLPQADVELFTASHRLQPLGRSPKTPSQPVPGATHEDRVAARESEIAEIYSSLFSQASPLPALPTSQAREDELQAALSEAHARAREAEAKLSAVETMRTTQSSKIDTLTSEVAVLKKKLASVSISGVVQEKTCGAMLQSSSPLKSSDGATGAQNDAADGEVATRTSEEFDHKRQTADGEAMAEATEPKKLLAGMSAAAAQDLDPFVTVAVQAAVAEIAAVHAAELDAKDAIVVSREAEVATLTEQLAAARARLLSTASSGSTIGIAATEKVAADGPCDIVVKVHNTDSAPRASSLATGAAEADRDEPPSPELYASGSTQNAAGILTVANDQSGRELTRVSNGYDAKVQADVNSATDAQQVEASVTPASSGVGNNDKGAVKILAPDYNEQPDKTDASMSGLLYTESEVSHDQILATPKLLASIGRSLITELAITMVALHRSHDAEKGMQDTLLMEEFSGNNGNFYKQQLRRMIARQRSEITELETRSGELGEAFAMQASRLVSKASETVVANGNRYREAYSAEMKQNPDALREICLWAEKVGNCGKRICGDLQKIQNLDPNSVRHKQENRREEYPTIGAEVYVRAVQADSAEIPVPDPRMVMPCGRMVKAKMMQREVQELLTLDPVKARFMPRDWSDDAMNADVFVCHGRNNVEVVLSEALFMLVASAGYPFLENCRGRVWVKHMRAKPRDWIPPPESETDKYGPAMKPIEPLDDLVALSLWRDGDPMAWEYRAGYDDNRPVAIPRSCVYGGAREISQTLWVVHLKYRKSGFPEEAATVEKPHESTLTVDIGTTVSSIRQRISAIEDMTVDDVVLNFNGVRMDQDDRTVAFYGIVDGDTVTLENIARRRGRNTSLACVHPMAPTENPSMLAKISEEGADDASTSIFDDKFISQPEDAAPQGTPHTLAGSKQRISEYDEEAAIVASQASATGAPADLPAPPPPPPLPVAPLGSCPNLPVQHLQLDVEVRKRSGEIKAQSEARAKKRQNAASKLRLLQAVGGIIGHISNHTNAGTDADDRYGAEPDLAQVSFNGHRMSSLSPIDSFSDFNSATDVVASEPSAIVTRKGSHKAVPSDFTPTSKQVFNPASPRSLALLFRQADRAKPVLDSIITKMSAKLKAEGISVEVQLAAVKGADRAAIKARQLYNNDYFRLIDLVRLTLVVGTFKEMLLVLNRIEQEESIEVVRVKNRFDPAFDPSLGGFYRDMLLNVKVTIAAPYGAAEEQTHVAEVQITLNSIVHVKESGGHQDYGLCRVFNCDETAVARHIGGLDGRSAVRAASGIVQELKLDGTRVSAEVLMSRRCLTSGNSRISMLSLSGCAGLDGFSLSDLLSPAVCTAIGKTLEELDISCTGVAGWIPPCLFQECIQLRTLNLSRNKLGRDATGADIPCEDGGGIPFEIGLASSLQACRLGRNHLRGVLPPSIGNLENLLILECNENALIAPIPAELGKCASLLKLRLQDNRLAEHKPGEPAVELPVDAINKLRYLTFFDVERNRGLFKNAGAVKEAIKSAPSRQQRCRARIDLP